jgi:hypothetical protein
MGVSENGGFASNIHGNLKRKRFGKIIIIQWIFGAPLLGQTQISSTFMEFHDLESLPYLSKASGQM